jgi:hypothetical protein
MPDAESKGFLLINWRNGKPIFAVRVSSLKSVKKLAPYIP